MRTHIVDMTTTFNDIPHIATTLWYSGCNVKCDGCQNTVLEHFKYGMSLEELEVKLKERRKMSDWIVHLGGNPLDSIDDVIAVSEIAKELGFQQFLYSGYDYSEFEKMFNSDIHRTLLRNIQYIKTGKYDSQYSKNNCQIEGVNYFFESYNQEVYKSKDVTWERYYGFDFNSKSIYGNLLI